MNGDGEEGRRDAPCEERAFYTLICWQNECSSSQRKDGACQTLSETNVCTTRMTGVLVLWKGGRPGRNRGLHFGLAVLPCAAVNEDRRKGARRRSIRDLTGEMLLRSPVLRERSSAASDFARQGSKNGPKDPKSRNLHRGRRTHAGKERMKPIRKDGQQMEDRLDCWYAVGPPCRVLDPRYSH